MSTLTIVLVILLVVTLLLVGTLFVLRQRRKARKASNLPAYTEKRISTSSTHSNHRRVNARPSQSIHIYNDKELRIESDSMPPSPTSSLPEIRITFPEEVDALGKRQSGRVVVVHVGDTGVGLEPIGDRLPAYELHGGEFQSVDLEKVGGLIEKEGRPPLGWK
jgi:hypothetical protein